MNSTKHNPSQTTHFDTKCLHSDRNLENNPDLAPPIHVSTSFAPNEDGLSYSRSTTVTRSRTETVLGTLEGGKAILYSSGVAATFAFLSLYKPSRIAIDGGYHGTHSVINALKFSSNLQNFDMIDLTSVDEIKKGDIVWLESPRNPTLEVVDFRPYVEKAKKVEARVIVDSTGSTPALCRPLEFGVDAVLHSTTKFLGGHSDCLGGALIVKDPFMYVNLLKQRTTMGNVPGSLEVWLLLRSLRTLPIRMERQSQTAEKIVQFLLRKTEAIKKVYHPSLETCKGHELIGPDKQMKYGGPIISFVVTGQERAKKIPELLKLIIPATSFGGCETTIDWRARSDPNANKKLLRLSVGLEHTEDLISDLEQALDQVLQIPEEFSDEEEEGEENIESEDENERLSESNDENEKEGEDNEREVDSDEHEREVESGDENEREEAENEREGSDHEQ